MASRKSVSTTGTPGQWAVFGWPSGAPVNTRCVAPLPHGWLALTVDGLVDVDRNGEAVATHTVRPVREEPTNWAGRTSGPAVHASPDGRFASVVTDYGRHGQIVALQTGTVTCTLDRGTYHQVATPFPACFVEHDGRTSLVAATTWNRLDAFDPTTGTLLTPGDTAWQRTRSGPRAGRADPVGPLTWSPDRSQPFGRRTGPFVRANTRKVPLLETADAAPSDGRRPRRRPPAPTNPGKKVAAEPHDRGEPDRTRQVTRPAPTAPTNRKERS